MRRIKETNLGKREELEKLFSEELVVAVVSGDIGDELFPVI